MHIDFIFREKRRERAKIKKLQLFFRSNYFLIPLIEFNIKRIIIS